jgi:hypothetical protein
MDAIITASTRAVALWLPEVAASSNVIPTTSRVFYRYLPIRRQSGRDPDRLHSVRMAKNYRPIGLDQSFQRKRLIIKRIGR